MNRRVELDEPSLRELFEGTFGDDRLRTVLTSIEEDAKHIGGVLVRGEVLEPSDSGRVGHFSRRIYHTGSGDLEVFSDGIEIEDPYRGHGFASQFALHVEDGYKTLGVRCVRLTAGRGDGGRAWARSYDFDDERLPGFGEPATEGGPSGVGRGGEHVVLAREGSREDLRRELVREIFDAATRDGRITDSERKQLDPLLPRLTVPSWIAALPRGVGDDVLRGARWPGIRLLMQG